MIAATIGVLGSSYAIFGGLKSVAVSDTLNGVGLLIGGLAIPALALAKLGDGSFMDGLSTDLERLNQINHVLLKSDQNKQGSTEHFRPIKTLVVVPKIDIREVAAHYIQQLPRALRLVLQGLGLKKDNDMRLVSYLLFESGFTRELIGIGYSDAIALEEELREFLLN